MTWEQRFNEQWADLTFKSGSREHYEQLKSFIRELLAEAKEQGRQEGMKLGEQVIRKEFEDAEEMFTKRIQLEERKKVVEILERMKKEIQPPFPFEVTDIGWNSALDNAIKKLQ